MTLWIDLTMRVSAEMTANAMANEKLASFGHLGTHFDVMNLEFPLDFARRSALIVAVEDAAKSGMDIELDSKRLALVQKGDFVIFRTGVSQRVPYGTPGYFTEHPQLSVSLIEALIRRKVAMIGIDAAGIRRGAAHTPMDQYCAERGIFVVENLANLEAVLKEQSCARCDVYTFPVKFEGLSGLPCRVMAEVT